jgi:hypothetical protein
MPRYGLPYISPATAVALNSAAAAIQSARNIRDLAKALNAGTAACQANAGEPAHAYWAPKLHLQLALRAIDMSNLPTFGGEEPPLGCRSWSWSATQLLTGPLAGPFKVERREGWVAPEVVVYTQRKPKRRRAA